MDITTANQIIEVLDYLCKKFGIVINWSSETVMPYLEQLGEKYIRWEISTSIVWLLIGICLIIIPIYICIKIKKNEKYRSDDFVGVCIIACSFIILGIPVLMYQIFDIIKFITIPELQIYEYITSLIETMN